MDACLITRLLICLNLPLIIIISADTPVDWKILHIFHRLGRLVCQIDCCLFIMARTGKQRLAACVMQSPEVREAVTRG